MKSKNTNEQSENAVVRLRERFRKIKENRKPSKAVEETFITPIAENKREQEKSKKIAHTPEVDL